MAGLEYVCQEVGKWALRLPTGYYPRPIGLRTFYVSPSGSDSNPGTRNAPWQTIGYAHSQAQAGDVIYLMDGVYNGYFHITKANTTWISENRWGAKINAAGNDYGITLGASNIAIIGVEVYNANRVGLMSWTYNSANVFYSNKFLFCHVYNIALSTACDSNGAAGIVSSSYSYETVIANCLVHDVGDYASGFCTTMHGIYVQGRGVLVQNNICYRCRGYGFDSWHRAEFSTWLNNLAFNNLYGGFSCGSDTPGFTVTGLYVANNIFVNNGQYGVQEVSQIGSNQYVNNIIWNNPTNIVLGGTSTQTGTINADPQFVNYQADGSGDYALRPTSPARNAGVLNSLMLPYDHNGRRRIVGSNPDIGPIEYGANLFDEHQLFIPKPLELWDFWDEVYLGSTNVAASSVFLGAAISSGTNTTAPAIASMFGYNPYGVLLRSGTSANGGYRYQTASLTNDYFGVTSRKFRCIFSWQTSFSGRTVRMGFLDTNTSSDATDGAYFEVLDNIVYAKTANNATRTTHGTTYTLSLNVPHTFDIEVDAAANNVRFRIYAGNNPYPVYDQMITTNIPKTSARGFGAGIVATEASTTASDIGVLYYLGVGTIEGFTRTRGQNAI